MQIWLWQHIVNPTIAGIFFAIGHFLVYYLTTTKPLQNFESFFILKKEKPCGSETKKVDLI